MERCLAGIFTGVLLLLCVPTAIALRPTPKVSFLYYCCKSGPSAIQLKYAFLKRWTTTIGSPSGFPRFRASPSGRVFLQPPSARFRDALSTQRRVYPRRGAAQEYVVAHALRVQLGLDPSPSVMVGSRLEEAVRGRGELDELCKACQGLPFLLCVRVRCHTQRKFSLHVDSLSRRRVFLFLS